MSDRKHTSRKARRQRDGDVARRCIVTRETLSPDDLIRFVVGPENRVFPDIDRKLPGRGLWLRARRDILTRACERNAFAAALRKPVDVSDGLVDQVERMLLRRCIELIGLARRAGQAVAGFEKVRAACNAGHVGVLLSAVDGSPAARERMRSLRRDTAVVGVLDGAEIGSAFGRDFTVHAALAPGRLAQRLAVEGERLAGFRQPPDVRELSGHERPERR